MEDIRINPIGRVISSVDNPENMPLGGQIACIEIFPQYTEALLNLEENSHIWVISWFHKAPRDLLRTAPKKINPESKEYGVFALRAFSRPNPIGLSLVKLIRIEENFLYVKDLDAISETPVIDIKPYFENDSIFSPTTSYIRGKDREMRKGFLFKRAVNHHQEECADLLLGVRMGVIAEEQFGHLNSPDLLVEVEGSNCLADVIQGMTRARLGNPPRFKFRYTEEINKTVWSRFDKTIVIETKGFFSKEELEKLKDDELFRITFL